MGKKKGGGAEAQKASEKAKQKKRDQSLADKTFGLKNKNKSKVVQNKVQHLQNSMSKNPQANKSAAAAKARKAQKEAEEQARREMELMFKSVKKKETVQQQRKVEEEEVVKKVTVKPEVRIKQLLDGTLPEMLERTLEDRIEEARSLVAKKVKMTEAVFTDWLNKKEKEKREREKKAKEARWKANRYTGKEIWAKFKVKVEDEEDAVDGYDKSSNPPSDDEDEGTEGADPVSAPVDPTVG
uniref:Uncharacterized protein n=1 Tax=Chloropicon laureae TaxID=464258 RepID=A0A7S3E356_9CHLO|mmetsp:Transcript_424/g.995  ORF Transcript_424/g.995 Transcript_424/m.995 type:complete len:240 (+) Transcript_424:279-998(+)|eukprot:CAMPEP_0197500268 /NCGR_PEP_ID=MMETSP1311-20131121/61442_1 /TAXON_ID=464262 /ORGANISM="Genus nov. species nov., Strain RCC856" /LENGTH=239 /DNA_ID=CAMNT_0043046021 /DNA_START=237 /DNA_END=956 /DNA_ORIENTATION=+